jgi:hypothetical protein
MKEHGATSDERLDIHLVLDTWREKSRELVYLAGLSTEPPDERFHDNDSDVPFLIALAPGRGFK